MTTTVASTLRSALDQARPGQTDDMFRLMKLGTMLAPMKRTFTGLTAAAFFDLTEIDGTGEVVGVSNPNRTAALVVGTLRVVAGAAAAGARLTTDEGGTPSATVATISDDGKTVTFEADVTGFVIEYIPRSAVDMLAAQPAFDGAP